MLATFCQRIRDRQTTILLSKKVAVIRAIIARLSQLCHNALLAVPLMQIMAALTIHNSKFSNKTTRRPRFKSKVLSSRLSLIRLVLLTDHNHFLTQIPRIIIQITSTLILKKRQWIHTKVVTRTRIRASRIILNQIKINNSLSNSCSNTAAQLYNHYNSSSSKLIYRLNKCQQMHHLSCLRLSREKLRLGQDARLVKL